MHNGFTMQLLRYPCKTLKGDRVRASTAGMIEVTKAPDNNEQYIIMHTNYLLKLKQQQNIQNQEYT